MQKELPQNIIKQQKKAAQGKRALAQEMEEYKQNVMDDFFETQEIHDMEIWLMEKNEFFRRNDMRFKRIYIEITNICNLACSFCIQNQRANKRMSVEEFAFVAKQIHPYTKHVYLHILGEPLSHPQLKEILDICAEYELYVNLTTNGTLLKDRKDILCKASALRQINVSLHSFPQHEQDSYINDVIQAGDELSANYIHMNYRLWSIQKGKLTPDTKTILDVIKECYNLDINEEQIKRMARMDLKEYVHLHFEDIFTWPSLQHPFISRQGKCHGMKQMCGILSNGDIVPCCLDSKGECVLGNIFSESFHDVIQTRRVQQIVKGFSHNDVVEELCQHCSYRLRFTKV